MGPSPSPRVRSEASESILGRTLFVGRPATGPATEVIKVWLRAQRSQNAQNAQTRGIDQSSSPLAKK